MRARILPSRSTTPRCRRSGGPGGAAAAACSLVIATLLAPLPAAAEIRLRCEIRQFGVFDVLSSSNVQEKDFGRSGHIRARGDTAIQSETSVVTMGLLRSFGIQTILLGRYPTPEADYDVVWTIPPRIDPETGEQISQLLIPATSRLGGRTLHGLTFTETWDMVPGEYRVELRHSDETLCSKNFDVIAASDLPESAPGLSPLDAEAGRLADAE